MWRLIPDLLTVTLSGMALMVSAYILFFAVMGIRLKRRVASESTGDVTYRVLILVPAHNEGVGITACIRSINDLQYPPHLVRLVVIADNCSDDTSEIAKECGAEVWSRNDITQRGKGYALAWAFNKAQSISYDLALIVDADSVVHRDCVTNMVMRYDALRKCGIDAVALQARYEFENADVKQQSFNTLTRLSKAAENRFTYLPRTSMKLVNLLQGNGFALSHTALQRVPFVAGSIVEDAEYAIDLALGGVPVAYVDDAVVVSRMTSSMRDAGPQRIRWASGMIKLMVHSIPRLISGAIRKRDWKLAEGAIMLLCTSRMILVYITACAYMLLLLHHDGTLGGISFGTLVLSTLFQGAYLWCVLKRSSDEQISGATIMGIPLYWGFLWCIQLWASVGFGRKEWKRTVR